MKRLFILILLFFPLSCFAQDHKLTVILDWFMNPDHAPIFVAQHDGFFKRAGLDVNIIQPADPNDGPKLVATGKADIVLTYQPQMKIFKQQGLPLQEIGVLVNQPLDCLSVLKSSPIHSIKDLKGKTIGFSNGAVEHWMLEKMLAYNGLTPKDVTLVNVKYNLITALLSKKVDAVNGFMRNVEPVQMALLGHPTRNFYPEDNGVPDYAELVWVSHDHLDAQKQQDVQAFIGALQAATAALKAHPNKAWLAFAQSYPALNTTFNKTSWAETVPLFDKNPAVT